MNYINAGVISPDEVRSVLREDVNSGYNTLAEEMEGGGENEENDPFADLLGGSETPQNPFSSDKWEEGDPRRANGQFGEGGSGKVEKSQRSDKIDSSKYKPIQISQSEYGMVFHAMKTNFPKMKNGRITKDIGNHTYTMQYKNGDFIIINRKPIDEYYD